MIIYSITISIDESHALEWHRWMLRVHIPEVMATGYFTAYDLRRIFEPEEEGILRFNIEYTCPSIGKYREYQAKAAPALQAAHHARYEGHYEAERVLMQRAMAPGEHPPEEEEH
jgi:hypothetical protein